MKKLFIALMFLTSAAFASDITLNDLKGHYKNADADFFFEFEEYGMFEFYNVIGNKAIYCLGIGGELTSNQFTTEIFCDNRVIGDFKMTFTDFADLNSITVEMESALNPGLVLTQTLKRITKDDYTASTDF